MGEPVGLRLQLLGRFSALVEGGELPIPSPRRRALLAYLAMQPGYGATRERLAALLWGDSPDRNARQSLRQALLALRQDFGPHAAALLAVEREAVRLEPGAITVDARLLLEASASTDPAVIDDAAERYAGPFLDGLNLAEAGFNEWLDPMRAQVEKAAASVLLQAALQADAAGNGGRAIGLAERLFRLDDTEETTHRLLLRLLARHQGRGVALARAQALADHLRRELEVEPDPETAALVDEIRRGSEPGLRPRAVPMRAPVVPQVPVPVPPANRPNSWIRYAWAGAIVSGAVLSVYALWPQRAMVPDQAGPLASAARVELSALQAQGQNPIMVLPLGAAPETPELVRAADRLTGDLIAELSLVGSLRVISRATSRLYQGRPLDVAAVGAELGIRYVVEGVVRSTDGHTRVDVALIDTTTRLETWAQRFEPAADGTGLEDQITRSIARQLQVSVILAEDARVQPRSTGDPRLDELLSRGWAAMVRMPSEGASAGAAPLFEEALARAPDNVSAKFGYAGSQIVAAVIVLGREKDFDLERAGRLLNEALQASPRNATGLLYRGMLKRLHDDLPASLEDFLAAIAVNPSFAVAYSQAAYNLYRLGEYDRAMEYVRYAMRLSPRDPGIGVWQEIAGMVEIERGEDAAAFEWLQQATRRLPHNEHCRVALMAVSMLRGDLAAAREHRRELAAFAPWITKDTVASRLHWDVASDTRKRLIEGATRAFALEQ